MPQVFVGDTGTEIVLECGVDLTTATTLSIVARKPNNARVTWTAVRDGTTAVKYTTLATDLDVAGDWVLQASVDMPTWKGRGALCTLTVSAQI